MNSNPRVIIIAGPNGASKTTFAREFLPKEAGLPVFSMSVDQDYRPHLYPGVFAADLTKSNRLPTHLDTRRNNEEHWLNYRVEEETLSILQCQNLGGTTWF